jgi:exopolysaccharide biosynthesis polyprenyl glycosylphosphotransferase
MRDSNIIKVLMLAGDFCIMQVALFLTLFFRNPDLLGQFDRFSLHLIPLYIAWVLVLYILNLYDFYSIKRIPDFLFNIGIFSAIVFFISIAYFYFSPVPGIAPKIILVLNILVFDIIFALWHYVVNFFFRIKGVKQKAVIVGSDDLLQSSLPQIREKYDVVAFFSQLSFPQNHVSGPDQAMVVNSIEDLSRVVIAEKVKSVIFALDFYSNKELVRKIFSSLPLTLNYVDFNDLYELMNKKVILENLNEIWFLEKVSKSENHLQSTIKRIVDLIVGSAGLVICALLFPITALLIFIDSPGKIFYSQQRVGKGGKIFTIYKFRTMYEHKNQNKETWRENNKNVITPLGKILRRLHLDELPQAWSLLKGDISFVGPRPEFIELAKTFEKEIPFYHQRYLVKTGIIGWAQINFPASHTIDQVKEKFQYDLYYIKNFSLLLDLEIILKAIKLFFWEV